MPEAVIVDAIRTPIGRAGKGSLKTVRADELAAIPIRALIERNPEVDFAQTTDVMMGAASSVGEQGYNVGRNASLLAGLDHHVPACTVNRFCASSLQTLRMAFHAIKAGEGDQYIAAGVEAVSRAGLGAGMMEEAKNPHLNGSNGSAYDVYIPMGMTAENVAQRCNVTREQQDEWAVTSQSRAVDARDSGHFDPEIVPVPVPAYKDTDKEGNEIDVPDTVVTKDDGPRAGHDDGGAGQAEARVPPGRHGHRRQRLSAQRRRRGGARDVGREGQATRPHAQGADHRLDGRRDPARDHGPWPHPGDPGAARRQTGVNIDDVDVVEINEAFAAQIVPCKEELGIPDEKLNPFGGAIALGHPFGMTGARIMTTLINGLRALDGTLGIESMCVAGGMGQAMLIERLS